MALPKQKIAVRPNSQDKLEKLARKLLEQADVVGVLPTPIPQLFEIAKVTKVADLPDEEGFLKTLTERARETFKSAKQKIRGIAVLRARATYIVRDANRRRQRFVEAHELGHQTIPWHTVDPIHLDDFRSLSPNAKELFEQEANCFAAKVIFQGSHFRTMARDYRPSFEAVFGLADRHDESRQATAWRYVEEQDEAIALFQYYPTNAIDDRGNCVLGMWRSVASPSFKQKFATVDPPRLLRTGHPWVAARDRGSPCEGADKLLVDDREVGFRWICWWSGRALLVLLVRRPLLSLVGGIIRPS